MEPSQPDPPSKAERATQICLIGLVLAWLLVVLISPIHVAHPKPTRSAAQTETGVVETKSVSATISAAAIVAGLALFAVLSLSVCWMIFRSPRLKWPIKLLSIFFLLLGIFLIGCSILYAGCAFGEFRFRLNN